MPKLERGGRESVIAVRWGDTKFWRRRFLCKSLLSPAVVASSVQSNTKLVSLFAYFSQTPAVFNQLLWWFGCYSRDRAPLTRTTRGLGLAPRKQEKAAKCHFGVSPTHVQIKSETYEARLGFLLFIKGLPGYFAPYNPLGGIMSMGDVHPNAGKRSLHLRRDLSDNTNTHRHLISVIVIGI